MKYIVECFDMQHANYAMWTVKGQTVKWETPVKMFKKDRIYRKIILKSTNFKKLVV